MEAWLGDIHYRNAAGQDVRARGAVYCTNRKAFDTVMSAYLARENATLVWSEEVHPVLGWFRKFGHNKTMADLARSVCMSMPVKLYTSSMEEGERDGRAYLSIKEIKDVTPLGAQLSITVPEVLQQEMFPHPEAEKYGTSGTQEGTENNMPPTQTFSILDAGKMPYLLTSQLLGSGLKYQSLFQGSMQEELKEYAPYLVQLKEGSNLVRKLFTGLKPPLGLWEKELGIFLRSQAGFDALHKHFRKFTRIQDENGKWYYFRFWEPRVLAELGSVLEEENGKKFFLRNITFYALLHKENKMLKIKRI